MVCGHSIRELWPGDSIPHAGSSYHSRSASFTAARVSQALRDDLGSRNVWRSILSSSSTAYLSLTCWGVVSRKNHIVSHARPDVTQIPIIACAR